MKKIILVSVVILAAAMFGIRFNQNSEKPKTTITAPTQKPEFIPYTANFEIYTNGTKRIFTDQKYHNKSEDVYIEPPNTSIVNVKKPNITWSDFFETLPMKLDKDCLITGTGQVFCSGDAKKLRFYINSLETPDALDKVIESGNILEVKYK